MYVCMYMYICTHTHTQACFFKSKEDPEGSKNMIKFLQDLTQETVIDIKSTIASAEVRSCTQDKIELQIQRWVSCIAVTVASIDLVYHCVCVYVYVYTYVCVHVFVDMYTCVYRYITMCKHINFTIYMYKDIDIYIS